MVQPVIGVAQVDLHFSLPESNCQTVLHVLLGDASTDLEVLQWVADQVALKAAQYLPPVCSSNLRIGLVTATSLDSLDDPQATSTLADGTFGSLAGPHLPNECVFCLTKDTSSRSRGARGKLYHPGLTSSQQGSPNHLTTGAADAILAAWTQIHAGLVSASQAGVTAIVLSRIANGIERIPPIWFPYTTLSYTDLTIDSMKRRKPGVGQ